MTKPTVTDEMVNRFLSWRLPSSFNPDCGISFKRTYNESSPYGPAEHEPTGTNLLDAVQARAMLEHVLAGCTQAPAATEAPSDEPVAMTNLRAAVAFLDQVLAAPAEEAATRTGALKDAREWLDSAARQVVATPAPAVGAAATEAPSDELTADQIDAIDERGPLIEGWRVVFENGRNGPGCYAYFKDIHNGDDCYFLGATPAPAVGAKEPWFESELIHASNAGYAQGLIDGKALAAVGASVQPVLASLSDEQIDEAVTKAVRSNQISWTGYDRDGDGKYTIPSVNPFQRKLVRIGVALASSTPTKGGEAS